MCSRRILAACMLLSFSAVAHAQLPPDKALSKFKVSDGLEITLWASEPMFVNPTCIDIDHKGRVWVCESVNYRMKLRGQTKMRQPEGDRIVVLEDTKGAGRADKVTVFYQSPEIICPLGIACAPYLDTQGMKVYVCHSPHIYVFEDKDGDCKADGPPKILLTGFKGYDHDHGVHGILIGPDNKLYFSVGDQGVKDLQSSDGKGRKWTSNSTDCRAGTIWRCDLDGKNLELIAHNFRNNYEPCVDSFGTIFISDNDDDGLDQTRICYVMPGGNYGYHPRGKGQSHWHEEQPGVVPKVLRTYRGSPCGMCFYEGTLLPKKYWGQPLHVDAGPGRLSCYHLKPKGAGYDIDREDMVTSTDSYFRPSDVCIAPDGSVFISDWYDQGVGGHGVKNLEDGRIYRMAPKGHKGSVSAVDVSTKKGLYAALGSPNLAVRSLAMAKWDENPREARNADWEHAVAPVLPARYLWQLWRFDTGEAPPHLSRNLVEAISGGPKELPPGFVIRLDKDCRTLHFPKTPPQGFGKAIAESPIASAREVLLALRNEDPSIVTAYLYELAKLHDGKDRFYLAALGIAVGQPGISAEIDKRREIILADFEKHVSEWNDKVAGLVWELRPPGMVPMLEKHLANAKLSAAQRGQIVDLLAGSADESAATVLLKGLDREKDADLRSRILTHFKGNLTSRWEFLRKTDAVDDLIARALNSDAAARETALSLVEIIAKDRWLAEAKKLALDRTESAAVRVAAIRALGSFKVFDATSALELVVKRDKSEALHVEAVNALGRQSTQLSLEDLQIFASEAEFSLPVRQAAVAGLASTRSSAQLLLHMYSAKHLAADLTPDLARLLRSSPYPEVKNEARKLFPPPPKLDPKNLPSIAALLARQGSLERGKTLMLATLKNDAQCLKCHTIQGVGGNAGPDLSTVGSKLSREALLESILYPSRAINHQYETWNVETKQGLSITGIMAEENTDFLVLRDANVKDHKIAHKDVDSRKKSPVSIMPDNLIVNIPEADLVDLVEYMYSLKNIGFVPAKGD